MGMDGNKKEKVMERWTFHRRIGSPVVINIPAEAQGRAWSVWRTGRGTSFGEFVSAHDDIDEARAAADSARPCSIINEHGQSVEIYNVRWAS